MPKDFARLVAVTAALASALAGALFVDLPAGSATAVMSPAPVNVALSAHPGAGPTVLSRRPLYPLPAAPARPEPCALGPNANLPSRALLASHGLSMKPVAGPLAARHLNPLPVMGKGIWITDFPGQPVSVPAVISLARRTGLSQLWVRVGSTHDGFYGGPLLKALVPRAHARGIHVVAWDFPTLVNPAADAARARQALADGADAFSPDIETPAEGTDLTVGRVTAYLSRVRAIAGPRPVVATVPDPLSGQLVSYPYAAEAPFVDAFAPMVYWSCTEPGAAVANAVSVLSHLRPVVPIGQDYNMASEGGRVGLPSGREIWRFLNVAARAGAIGASLYDLESGGPVQLKALAAYPW